MQLKIIERHGQCRGRPPTKGKSREGPGVGTVGSRQLTFIKRRKPLPRDWPNYTCSVSRDITQNRDKDRWRTTVELAARWQGGKIMPYSEQYEN